MINKVLAINIFILIAFCLLLSYLNYRFAKAHENDSPYIFADSEDSASVMALKSFGSFFLVNNSFIPIDLAVGLEMGKFMYIYFLQHDLQMTVFDVDKRDLVSCSVKNFNLHEDLA